MPKDRDKAVLLFRKACAGESASGCNNAAWYMAEEEKPLDVALRLARKAVSLASSARNFDTLAYVHYKRKEYREAEEQLLRALKLEPEEKLYQDRLKEIRQAMDANPSPSDTLLQTPTSTTRSRKTSDRSIPPRGSQLYLRTWPTIRCHQRHRGRFSRGYVAAAVNR